MMLFKRLSYDFIIIIVVVRNYNTKYLYAIINNNQVYNLKNENPSAITTHRKYDILPIYINIIYAIKHFSQQYYGLVWKLKRLRIERTSQTCKLYHRKCASHIACRYQCAKMRFQENFLEKSHWQWLTRVTGRHLACTIRTHRLFTIYYVYRSTGDHPPKVLFRRCTSYNKQTNK